MKQLLTYIKEALDKKIQDWIKNILDNQEKLVKSNTFKPIDVNVENLTKPEKEFLYDDYYNDPIFKKIISNNKFGFTVINQMIKIPKTYMNDNGKTYQPDCFPYWYKEGDNIYFIGLCLYDKKITYIENYLNIIGIESSLMINNSKDVNKAILNDFIKTLTKLGDYEGLTINPKHPKMKALFLQLGFLTAKENKDILMYKI